MNKKIVILVVVVECILAILLISVMGLAIESYFNEVNAQEISFTTFTDDVQVVLQEGQEDTWLRTADGRIILRPGTLYREKEKTVEWLPTPEYNDETVGNVKQDIIIEFVNPENVSLKWVIVPANTSEMAVTFNCEDEEVEIEESGMVHFLGEVHSVQVTVRTKNGKAATVWLTPRKSGKT